MRINNENGSVLILTLVVMLSLLLLGGALIQYAVLNARGVTLEEQSMQAYYIARSGADAMAEAIIKNPGILDDIGNSATSESTDLGDGTFMVSVSKAGGAVMITSTGVVNSRTQVVSLRLDMEPGGGFVPDFDMAVFASGQGDASDPAIHLNNGTINGDIGTNATGVGAVRITGNPSINGGLYFGSGDDGGLDVHEWVSQTYSSGAIVSHNGPVYRAKQNTRAQDQPGSSNRWELYNPVVDKPSWWNNVETIQQIDVAKDYPEVDVAKLNPPEGLSPRGTLIDDGGADREIVSDGQYDRIYVTGNRTLTIDLQGGTRRILVSELRLDWGHIALKNVGENGRLELYVEDSLIIRGSINYHYYQDQPGDPSNVKLVFAGTDPIGAGDQFKFSGNLIVKEANLVVGSGSTVVGNVVSNGSSLTVTGGGAIKNGYVYAPKATVNVAGGAHSGAIVSKKMFMDGGATITWYPPELNTNGFPFDIFKLIDNNGGSPGIGGGYTRVRWSSN